MNDAELVALAALVNAEVSAMNAENRWRVDNGYSIAYGGASYTSSECVRRLEAELHARGVLQEIER